MDFPKTITIEACEQFMVKLQSGGEQILELPVDTFAPAFGGLASAVQAANTWVRAGEQRQVLIRPSAKRDVLADILERPHKFAAAMCAKSITMADNPDVDVRANINLQARDAIEGQARSPYGQQRGRLSWFAFVDHSSKAFDRNFYIEKPGEIAEPRQAEQLKAVIKAMVEKSMSVAAGARPLSGDRLDSLGRIFYELFLNTHQHGSRGLARSEWLRPGVRILYTHGLNLDDASSANIADRQPALQQYLKSTESQEARERRRFVELGIVDSGLGYCGRWLADHAQTELNPEPSLAEEYQIFRKCFQFRQTSTQRDSKGNGLPAVMEKLTRLSGFLRVRSGRLALYRNFVDSPYTSDDECGFYDWASGEPAIDTVTEMAGCAGVSITLLIPLEAKS